MTRNADRKTAARSLAYAMHCSYQQALAEIEAFPSDVRIEFPDGRATVTGRLVRCDLTPSIMHAWRAWCELCPWEFGGDPLDLRDLLAHDAYCPGTPEHLELIGPRTWRRIPDAELDRRAANARARRRPTVESRDGTCVAEQVE